MTAKTYLEETLHDDSVGSRKSCNDLSNDTLVVTGDNFYFVTFFDLHSFLL